MGEAAFADWGWRIRSWSRSSAAGHLGVDPPVDERVAGLPEDEGRRADLKAPLTESFGQWKNLKIVLLALFGLTAGQAVVWYTGQFYALFFLTQTLKGRRATANLMIAASLLIGTPFFIVFGWLSGQDRPQAHHHGGLPDRRADLLPAVQGADRGRQPGDPAAALKNKVVVRRPAAARSSSTRSARRSSPAPATSPPALLAGGSVSMISRRRRRLARRHQDRRDRHRQGYGRQGPVRRRPEEEGRRVQGWQPWPMRSQGRNGYPAKADPAKT